MTGENGTRLERSAGVVCISRKGDGLELRFPPMRAPGVALALGAFGAVSSVLSMLALFGVIPAGGSDAHGLLVVALVGAFIVPFLAFGLAFAALAIYMLANSLTVTVSNGWITAVRRVFGLTVSSRALSCGEVAAIEPRASAKYQNLFSAEPIYQLIARGHGKRGVRLVIAEDLRGETSMTRVRNLIESAISPDQRNATDRPANGVSGIRPAC